MLKDRSKEIHEVLLQKVQEDLQDQTLRDESLEVLTKEGALNVLKADLNEETLNVLKEDLKDAQVPIVVLREEALTLKNKCIP